MHSSAVDRPPRETSACADANAVVEFLDGRMPAAARGALEAHVDGCSSCRRVLSAMVQAHRHATATATCTYHSISGPGLDSLDGFLPIGEVVDRYVIRGAIGAGAMGVVYAARDPALERDLAIKVVKVRGGEDPGAARSRLLREARSLARLSHPNVVAVYDTGMHGGELFIALELFDGPNLRDWLRAAPRSRAEIVDALLAAGRGLAAAHAAGIVHRDVKPENIVIGCGGRVAVTDFGVAVPSERCVAGDVTDAGAFAGTPAYMSPEQLCARPSGPACDQFGFAVMAHEALFGAHPFPGRTLEERRCAVQRGPPRVRGSLARALRRALAVDPAARYPSVEALLAALIRAARVSPPLPSRARIAAVLAAAGAIAWLVLHLGVR